MARKTAERVYKIGDVCRVAGVQPYVLRYWETEFPSLAPTKGGGGQRVYSQREVEVVLRIKELLYGEGFTIAGAKKKLEQEQSAPAPEAAAKVAAGSLTSIREELQAILEILRK